MHRIDTRLFQNLFISFIAATIVGTLAHELGHYFVAKYFGYYASINYASTSWSPANPFEIVNAKTRFYITLGGPLQTILTGTIGVALLLLLRKKYFSSQKLNWWQWSIIFISLFWLRQTANFITWIASYFQTGHYSMRGDELKMATYFELPPWSIISLTALIGLTIFVAVVFKFIPPRQRLTFVTAGLTGGITGYILWIVLLGKYIMP